MAQRKLEVMVVADTSGFTAGMRQVTSALQVVQGGFTRFTALASRVSGAFVRIASKIGALSAAIAGGGFSALIVNAFRTTGALSHMSRQLGVTVADLARAKQAAILSGMGASEFTGKLRGLVSQLDRAGDKAGQFQVAIQAWVTGVAKAGGEADAFGLTVTDAFARMVERANVAAVRLRQAFVGRFRQIAVAIAPFIEFAANKLTDFMNDGTTGAKLVDRAMLTIRDTIGLVLDKLAEGQGMWLTWKVAGLDAMVSLVDALRKPISMFEDLRLDAVDFWSQVLSGTSPGAVKFTSSSERGGPSNKLNFLEKALVDARKQLREFGKKPEWADDFRGWWDDLIEDAKKKMNEFAEIAKAPNLSDIKLPELGQGARFAPSVEAGSALAARTSFAATNQGKTVTTQKLGELVVEAKKQSVDNRERNRLLDILVRNGELIQVRGI